MGVNQLIDDAELGEVARVFVQSDLGKAMIGLAAQEVWIAQDALGKVDPENPKEIRQLQNQVWLGEHFKQWLEEIIDKGDSALAVYKDQNQG